VKHLDIRNFARELPDGRTEVRMTVKEYAAFRRRSERTIRRWIARGVLTTNQPTKYAHHEVVFYS
jgi:hypothetical protein